MDLIDVQVIRSSSSKSELIFCSLLPYLGRPVFITSTSTLLNQSAYLISLITTMTPLCSSFLVTGCPEPEVPPGTYMTRDGDHAFFYCSHPHRQQHTWKMSCKGTEWIGQTGYCIETTSKYVKPQYWCSLPV